MCLLGKCDLKTNCESMIGGMMKCIRDFENDHFGKTIVLCGKLLWGDLDLLV
jgi:hypothetical protein